LENNPDPVISRQQIIAPHIVQHLEQGLNADEKQLEAGYVTGYNSYLAHVGGAKGVPDPTCRGKSWVKPITLFDSYLLFYQDMLEQSSGKVIRGITEAAPPTPAPATHQGAASPARTARALAAAWRAQTSTVGINAVAIGSAGTRDHLGLLLANPHQPWFGAGRFYQAQLTIPGKTNVTGASLYGIPLILIGHNENVAWSHTSSTAFRFTPFQLTLVKGHPTEYLQNGNAVAMTPREVTVLARQPNGTLAPVTHTLVDPLRPGLQQLRRPPAALDHHHGVRLRRRQREQPRPGVQHLVRLRPRVEHPADAEHPEEVPGHPLGQHDRDRPGRPGPVRRHRHHPERHQRRGEQVRHTARQELGAADPQRRHDLLRLGERPRRRRARHLRAQPRAVPAAPRLRHQLQRQLLAGQPAPPADRVRPDHRHREHRADHADPDRPDPGAGANRRHRRTGPARLHAGRHAPPRSVRRLLRGPARPARPGAALPPVPGRGRVRAHLARRQGPARRRVQHPAP